MLIGKGKQPTLRVGARTDTGRVREENQDHMSRFYCPLGEVLVVADGMGGHKGGGLAAEMVARGFEDALSSMPVATPVPLALQTAAQRINEAIHAQATSGNPETEKMGSTVVLCLIQGTRLTVAHIGDSRAYLFRKGRLQRLTRDHTRIQKMIDNGFITEREAKDHPDASILNRSMGGKPAIEIEVAEPLSMKEGDCIVLCSDGLCGYVQDDLIGRTLAPLTDAQTSADALVNIALSAGGEDNVTVQVLQVGERKPTTYVPSPEPKPLAMNPGSPSPRRPSLIRMTGIAGAATLLLAGGIMLGIYAPWNRAGKAPAAAPEDSTSMIGSSFGATKAAPKEDGTSAVKSTPDPKATSVDEKKTENENKEKINVYILWPPHTSDEEQMNIKNIVKSVLGKCSLFCKENDGKIKNKVYFKRGFGEMALKIKKEFGFPEKSAAQLERNNPFYSPEASIVIIF